MRARTASFCGALPFAMSRSSTVRSLGDTRCIVDRRAPSKVDELILISSGFYVRGVPGFLRYLFFPLDRIMARQFYKRSVRAASLKRSFYNQAFVTDELINAYLLPAKTPHAADALARMITSAGIGPREGLANTISMPSLLVFGDQDTNNLPGRGAAQKELKHKLQP